MSFSCLTIWLLIIQLNVVTVLGEECPVCTNKYDHNTCAQTQSCDADMNYCELIVKPDDFYSLEYVCKQALECTKQTTVPCDPSANKTCIYCCDGPTICQLQREELYNNEFPASGFLVQSTTSESPVGKTSATLLVTTPTESVVTKLSTAHTTTSATTTTLPEGNVIECPVCSDAYDHATCLGVQKCPLYADAVCQLVVQTTGLLRLEYQCGRYEVCAVRETAGCHPEVNDTCVYCCSDPIVCQLQRDDLFKYEFPDLGLQVSPTTASTAGSTSTTSSTTRSTASTVRSTSTTSSTTRSTAVVPTKTPATRVTRTTSTTTLSPADSATIECPVCSDKYDHTTCSGIQKCPGDDAVCQLVIHTTGLLGLEYQCGHFEVCAVREADGCHPRVNNTCVYCCSDSIICQIQRDDLFTYELPSLGLPTNIAATSVSTTTTTRRTTRATTHTPVTTISQTTSTVSPATETETTAASTAAQTTKASTTTTTASTRAQTTASTRAQTTASTRAQTTASTRAQTTASTRAPPTTTTRAQTTASTRAPTTTTTTASTRAPTTTTLQTATTSPTTPAVSVIECVQCGSLSGHTPCSQDNHAVNTPQPCPGYLPYCFTSYTQNGTEISAYKGCAAADFCSLEYEITSTKKECDGDPDPFSPRHVSCGYCCNRDACNASLKPPASSLVTFS